ncbi:hypothetical protein [Antricoccus suffuscus]|nr:hypothetical protein [Antricoccus suffuscus]
MADSYDVVWPLGRRGIENVEAHDRPNSLDGKTVAFLWDYLFRGPEMFDAIEAEITSRYSDVTFVSHEEFGNFHASMAAEKRILEQLPEMLHTRKVDLVIAAVGA